jgi:CRP/FNR family transcriptional regulator, cyclic AMP receptor protein
METKIDLSILRRLPLFQTLTEAEIRELTPQAQVETREKNGLIYDVGGSSEYLYILEKGAVKTGAYAEEGREALKAICHPVCLFGELGLIGENRRREFARALVPGTRVIALPIEAFKKLMRANHDLCLNVLDQIGVRLLEVEKRMEAIIFQDARSRIIQFLKESASDRGSRVGFEWLFKHSLTQQDIANITGTSRQTVTSVLNELRKDNLIHFNRRSILIRDMAKLA